MQCIEYGYGQRIWAFELIDAKSRVSLKYFSALLKLNMDLLGFHHTTNNRQKISSFVYRREKH